MSNSTGSYCGSIRYSSDSGMPIPASPRRNKGVCPPANTRDEVRENSKAVKDGWESEVEGRILQYPDTTDEFIEDLLPTSTPFTLTNDIGDAFKSYDPKKGKE
ncbi:hypothetical protein BV20DRAFT_1058270, partial [Pilatotrama ljubarskyi]